MILIPFFNQWNVKHIINDLKNLVDLIDSSNWSESHELFPKKNKRVIGKFNTETPKKLWIDEHVCLRSKMYAFKCGDDNKRKFKRKRERLDRTI